MLMKNIGSKILVNSITMIRVVGTFLMPIITYNMSAGQFICYIALLLLTDSIDGIMARRLNSCTIFGALLDSAADKFLGISLFAVLAYHEPIMFLPIITEGLIMIINTRGATRGSNTESSFLGKFKTWVMGICIVLSFCTIFASDIINVLNEGTKEGAWLINVFNYSIFHKNLVINSLACVCAGSGLMVAVDYQSKVKDEVKKAQEVGINAKEYKLRKGKDLVYALFDTDYYYKTKNQPLLQRLGEREVINERKIKRK